VLPSSADAPADTAHDPHATEVVRALTRLRDIGMNLAEGLAPAVTDGLSAAEAALAYSRIARAVRLTCVLELRIAGDTAQQRAAEAEARRQAERAAREAAHEAGYAAKQDAAIPVAMILDEARETGQLSKAELEPLYERLETWAEDEDHELGFDALSQAEIFDAICQALQITPDPKLWAAGQLVEAIEAGLHSGKVGGASAFAKASADKASPATVATEAGDEWRADRELELADP